MSTLVNRIRNVFVIEKGNIIRRGRFFSNKGIIMEPLDSRKEYIKIGQETGEGRRERPQLDHIIIENTVARRKTKRVTGGDNTREPFAWRGLHENQTRKKGRTLGKIFVLNI